VDGLNRIMQALRAHRERERRVTRPERRLSEDPVVRARQLAQRHAREERVGRRKAS
jgi:hypothetical protein